jgi:hypothetical protein
LQAGRRRDRADRFLSALGQEAKLTNALACSSFASLRTEIRSCDLLPIWHEDGKIPTAGLFPIFAAGHFDPPDHWQWRLSGFPITKSEECDLSVAVRKSLIARVLRYALVFLAIVGGAALAWLYTPDRRRAALEAEYARPPSEFINVAGLRLHVRDTGPKSAPALIFLHGFGSSLQTWDDWARDLDKDHRVIRYDLPGFGLNQMMLVDPVPLLKAIQAPT